MKRPDDGTLPDEQAEQPVGNPNVEPVVLLGADAELVRCPADEIWLRAAGHGDIQIADYRSEDREGPPAHSHPLDEVQSLVEGEAEFRDVR